MISKCHCAVGALMFVCFVSVIASISALPPPAAAAASNDPNNEGELKQENLRHTFGDDDEIPAGFFDAPDSQSPVKTRQITAESNQEFAACKDGSGGLCIPVGQCSADKKPKVKNAAACEAGEECCFGLPPNTPCKNKGGECVKPPRNCGKGPQLNAGTECDHQNGETCCIWI